MNQVETVKEAPVKPLSTGVKSAISKTRPVRQLRPIAAPTPVLNTPKLVFSDDETVTLPELVADFGEAIYHHKSSGEIMSQLNLVHSRVNGLVKALEGLMEASNSSDPTQVAAALLNAKNVLLKETRRGHANSVS